MTGTEAEAASPGDGLEESTLQAALLNPHVFGDVECDVSELVRQRQAAAAGKHAEPEHLSASRLEEQLKMERVAKAMSKLRNQDPAKILIMAYKPYQTRCELLRADFVRFHSVGNGIPRSLAAMAPFPSLRVLNLLEDDEEGLVVLGGDKRL